jgi:hypothetical protein
MSAPQEASRWRFLITPKWLGWTVFVIAATAGMLWLGDWQLHRAMAGNGLSWAYTFEWPLFAIFAVVFWAKTIRDEVHPPAEAEPADAVGLPRGIPVPPPSAVRQAGGASGGGDAGEGGADDEELAAYNAYLARLTREVKGHGRWHGLR